MHRGEGSIKRRLEHKRQLTAGNNSLAQGWMAMKGDQDGPDPLDRVSALQVTRLIAPSESRAVSPSPRPCDKGTRLESDTTSSTIG